jgi:hypothetical protein
LTQEIAMTVEESRVSLKIDLASGLIEIDAPQGSFDKAVSSAKELLAIAPGQRAQGKPSVQLPQVEEPQAVDSSTDSKAPERTKKATRGASASAARPGRIGSFEPVDLGLEEAQERELRSFMLERAPAEQADQVAVAIYKGEQLLRRKGFTYNEIYTLLRLSGGKLPKALDVVLLRMSELQWVVRDGQQFSLKFVGRDHVEQKLGGAAQA